MVPPPSAAEVSRRHKEEIKAEKAPALSQARTLLERMGKSTWEIFWMPDKEMQRPSGRGEEGQGAKERHGKEQPGQGKAGLPPPSSSSKPDPGSGVGPIA